MWKGRRTPDWIWGSTVLDILREDEWEIGNETEDEECFFVLLFAVPFQNGAILNRRNVCSITYICILSIIHLSDDEYS